MITHLLAFLTIWYSPVISQKPIQNQEKMETINQKTEADLKLLTDYLVWGASRIIRILEALSEEEFSRPFNELSGNIQSKTAHILSIYEFFLGILDGNPSQNFPDLAHLSQDELISKWKQILVTWPAKLETAQGLYGLPLAQGKQVDASHIFLDAMFHTIHHRGQLFTFIRLLGKSKEEVSPSDTNTDYLMYLFQKHPALIHPSTD